jgi:hypothetical protein
MSKCVDLKNKLWLIPDNNKYTLSLLYFCDEKDCDFSVYSTILDTSIELQGKIIKLGKILKKAKCEDFKKNGEIIRIKDSNTINKNLLEKASSFSKSGTYYKSTLPAMELLYVFNDSKNNNRVSIASAENLNSNNWNLGEINQTFGDKGPMTTVKGAIDYLLDENCDLSKQCKTMTTPTNTDIEFIRKKYQQVIIILIVLIVLLVIGMIVIGLSK